MTSPVLSPREHDVLRLRALGYTTPAAALSLGIKEATARNHLVSAYRKAKGQCLVDALRWVGWLKVPVA